MVRSENENISLSNQHSSSTCNLIEKSDVSVQSSQETCILSQCEQSQESFAPPATYQEEINFSLSPDQVARIEQRKAAALVRRMLREKEMLRSSEVADLEQPQQQLNVCDDCQKVRPSTFETIGSVQTRSIVEIAKSSSLDCVGVNVTNEPGAIVALGEPSSAVECGLEAQKPRQHAKKAAVNAGKEGVGEGAAQKPPAMVSEHQEGNGTVGGDGSSTTREEDSALGRRVNGSGNIVSNDGPGPEDLVREALSLLAPLGGEEADGSGLEDADADDWARVRVGWAVEALRQALAVMSVGQTSPPRQPRPRPSSPPSPSPRSGCKPPTSPPAKVGDGAGDPVPAPGAPACDEPAKTASSQTANGAGGGEELVSAQRGEEEAQWRPRRLRRGRPVREGGVVLVDLGRLGLVRKRARGRETEAGEEAQEEAQPRDDSVDRRKRVRESRGWCSLQ